MIARLTGEVIDVRLSHIVVMVHGIGYLVAVPYGSSFTVGETVSLHTYLAVRENALDLYGFVTEQELSMFHELIKLPKIGPKTALQILSQASLEVIHKSVETNDPVYLTKMSGIGKKSAEKIVSGLKDAFHDGAFMGSGASGAQSEDADLIEALIALGYAQKDALQALAQVPKDIVDTNMRLKHVLKIISR